MVVWHIYGLNRMVTTVAFAHLTSLTSISGGETSEGLLSEQPADTRAVSHLQPSCCALDPSTYSSVARDLCPLTSISPFPPPTPPGPGNHHSSL